MIAKDTLFERIARLLVWNVVVLTAILVLEIVDMILSVALLAGCR